MLRTFAYTAVLFAAAVSHIIAADTDSDGLDDAVETNTGIFQSSGNTGTNPNDPDSDEDGVADGLEVTEATNPVNGSSFNSFSIGLTAYYPFKGSLGDKSGNNRDGSVYGTYQITPDGLHLIGDQALFYQNGGWFKPNATGMNNDIFTLSIWINNLSSGGVHQETHVLNIGAFGVPNKGLVCFDYSQETNSFYSWIYHPDIIDWGADSGINTITSKLNHFLIVKNNQRIFFLLNGKVVRDSVLAQDFQFLPTEFISLNHHWWNGGASSASRSTGTYWNLRLYDRALTKAQASSLFLSEATAETRFEIVDGAFTWHAAKADAETRGGRLAVLDTQKEIDDAEELLSNRGTWQNLWIGLTDEVEEGTWKWIDGSSPAVSKWANGEPDSNGGRNEDGAAIFTSDHGAWPGYWADAEQGQQFSYLFEKAPFMFDLSLLPTIGGNTSGAGPYLPGATATLTATPAIGYVFVGWTGDASGDTNPIDIVMDSDKSVVVDFDRDTSDSDGDGLSAYLELVVHGTNPNLADTDSDGFDDYFEVSTGFSPTSALSTPDTHSSIRTAVEFRFNAANEGNYRIESSTNLVDWNTVETNIIGNGGVITRFYSTENLPKRYFRARRN